MRRAAFIISSLAISLSATAQEQEEEFLTLSQINKGVLSAANAYAKAVSCVEALATPSTIFALTPLKTRDDSFDAKYLVFWDGDVG